MLYTLHNGGTAKAIQPPKQMIKARKSNETVRVIGYSSQHPTYDGGGTARAIQPPKQMVKAIKSNETVRITGYSSQHPTYDGVYEVTPMPFVDQTLRTSGKVLRDDVVMHEISYLKTSNESGGFTISIAS